VQVFRIAKARYIDDLSGTGAMLHGGRWNRKNIPLVYASENRSLATVEFLVHVPFSLIPRDLKIACLEILDDIAPDQISAADLPKGWRNYPPPSKLAELGSAWALSRRSLLLRVPSAVVPSEFNVLINPRHPQIEKVRVAAVEDYVFDRRLVPPPS
jgi:RES domain-containing protein